MTDANVIQADAGLGKSSETNPLLGTAQRGALERQLEQLKEQLLQSVLTSSRARR